MNLFQPLSKSALLLLLCSAKLPAQTYTDLAFSNPVQATDGTFDGLGAYYTGLVYDFLDVAPDQVGTLDLRAKITTFGNTTFRGSFPDYSASAGEPDGDLGFLYFADGPGIGGVEYDLNFYEGGGNFGTRKTVDDFRVLVYDVDGEENQSESIVVNTADGFYGYRLPSTNDVSIVDEGSGIFRFTGPGTNRAETDPAGAIVLYFRNTSSAKFRFESDTLTTSNFPNGVFSAIDGDLSLLGSDPDNAPPGGGGSYGGFVPVPEPSTSLLFATAATAMLTFRKRQ